MSQYKQHKGTIIIAIINRIFLKIQFLNFYVSDFRSRFISVVLIRLHIWWISYIKCLLWVFLIIRQKGGGGVSRQVMSEFYIAHNSFYANDSIGLCVCLHVECWTIFKVLNSFYCDKFFKLFNFAHIEQFKQRLNSFLASVIILDGVTCL